MNLSFKNNDGQITIFLNGRLDTAEAMPVTNEINENLQKIANITCLIIDASELEFISSSGLRIMLSLKKQYKDMHIVETSPDVYNVFEMTGFTKILDIHKALRRISIEGCPEIGRGGVGIVYKTAPDTIVKVFREGSPMEDLQKEITMAKESFILGMPTAISFDTVKVGNQYGLVYEMLNASTLSSLVKDNPEKTDEYARQFAHLVRTLHDIEVAPGGIIPNAHTNEEEALNKICRYFTDEEVDRLRQIFRSIPQGNRLLHCDLHPKNVMLQDGEMMLIDMGEVGYGNPLIELSHTYSSMMGLVGDYNAIVGFPEEQSHQFYMTFIREYYKGESEEEIQQHLRQIKILSYVRNFTWLSLSDSFPDEVIDACHKTYEERVVSQWDEIKKQILH